MSSPCEHCEAICPASGCAEWKDWYVANWNENIHRKVTIGLTGRQVFRYEHPVRVRELVAVAGAREVQELMQGSYLTPAQWLVRMGLLEGGAEPEIWEDEDDYDDP